MAGRGPQPKDPSKRARRNKEPAPLKVVPAVPVEQPPLPTFYVSETDPDTGEVRRKRFRWPKVTERWWCMWGASPLSTDYTDTDWAFLADTALLHARYWSGDLRVAAELRLRVAKFGATPEDRARLRITFAVADNAEAGGEVPAPAGVSSSPSRSRARKVLRVVD